MQLEDSPVAESLSYVCIEHLMNMENNVEDKLSRKSSLDSFQASEKGTKAGTKLLCSVPIYSIPPFSRHFIKLGHRLTRHSKETTDYSHSSSKVFLK